MAKQVLQRLSFSAGELSPWLVGRADLDPVSRGAARLTNFLVSPFGGLKRRPGTRLVALAGADSGEVRLVSFKYSFGVQFMLELGSGYIRYFKDGLPLRDSQGGIVQTSSPWKTASQLKRLRMQQLNDVIYCVEPETPPMTLSRYADDDWRLEGMAFSGVPYESALFNPIKLTCTVDRAGSVNKFILTTDEDVFTPDMVGRERIRITRRFGEQTILAADKPLFQWTSLNRNIYKGDSFSMPVANGWTKAYTCIKNFSKTTDYQPGLEAPERYTAFFEDGSAATMNIFVQGAWTLETTGTWDAEWDLCRGYFNGSNYKPNKPTLVWYPIKSFSQKEGFRNNFAFSGNEEESAYFRVRLKKFKTGGSTGTPELKVEAQSFDHQAIVSEYVSPRCVYVESALGTSYYSLDDFDSNDWAFGAFGPRNGYPGTVEFYQGRMWFGGTGGQPQTLWASRVDDFSDFKPGVPDDSALMLTISASQQNKISWIASLRGLMIGTGEGEWMLKASDSSGISANNALFERHSGVGSASLDALAVENSVLFVEQGGMKVREFFYSLEADGFLTRDVSLLSEHLTSRGIVDWTIQRSMTSHVWCVLKDGSAVCMTLNKEQNIVAWHVHQLDHGRILSVAALRGSAETPDEEVWFAVARGEGSSACITVERMAEDNLYMDAVTEAEVRDESVSGLMHLAGCRVFLYGADGVFQESAVDAQGRLSCPGQKTGESVLIGHPFAVEVVTMPLETLETLGRVKNQITARALLHGSMLHFQYGTGHSSAWRDFEPGRYGLEEPYSGYVRVTQNYGSHEQASFALRAEYPGAFNLLSLVLDVEV